MSQSKNYYVVVAGEVKPYDPCHPDTTDHYKMNSATDYDSVFNWCIVYAHDEADALRIADLYDAGEIDYDNVWCQYCNKAHPALNDKED